MSVSDHHPSHARNHDYCVLFVIRSYRDTLNVLKLHIAQRNQAIFLVVFLCQLESLSGFASLGVVKTHRPGEIDEHLHHLRGLGW